MTKNEALLMAIEALDNADYHKANEAITAIKATLEAKDEPVAWISATELLVMRGNALGGAKDWRVNLGLEPEEGDVGLYTTTPQRTWVGMTEQEIGAILEDINAFGTRLYTFARAIEARLKDLNT